MNEERVRGKVAVITGGSRGIGLAIAHKLANLGANIAILGRDRERLGQAAEELRAQHATVLPVACDLTVFAEVEAAAREVASQLGAPGILVNCAGVGLFGRKLLECGEADWERVMNTNLRGAFFATRAFAPAMLGAGGDIVNISSIASKNPLPGGALYAASKWGLNGLTYSLAEELREHNVRVSLVCPGSVLTEFSGHAGKSSERMLVAEDVAEAVALVVSQRDAAFVSEVILRPTRKP